MLIYSSWVWSVFEKYTFYNEKSLGEIEADVIKLI